MSSLTRAGFSSRAFVNSIGYGHSWQFGINLKHGILIECILFRSMFEIMNAFLNVIGVVSVKTLYGWNPIHRQSGRRLHLIFIVCKIILNCVTLWCHNDLCMWFSLLWHVCILQDNLVYTRKNLTFCNKSANKPSTRCIRTACHKLSTRLEQLVNNL